MQIIQNSLRSDSSAESRRRLGQGLELWKAKWDAHIRQMSPSQLEISGFVQDAGPEFWQLTCYLLTSRGEDTACAGSSESSCSTSQGVNVFEELFRSAKALI